MVTPGRGGRWQWFLAVLAATALAGCGSTVQSRGPGGRAMAGLDAVQDDSSLPSTGGPAVEDALTPGAPARGSGAANSRSGAGNAAGSRPGQQAAPSGAKQPPIQIGSYYLDGGNAELAAAGFAGLQIPDNKPLFEAMVKYLNANGGLGGRQIQPVLFKYVAGGDPQAQDAAACATFTQDHHVYLVIGGINSGANQLGPCLTKQGVPLIGANGGGDARYFAANHRFIYEPGQASYTRGLATLVANLQENGWFTGNHRIGVVQYEGATYDHAVDDGLIASLARLGHVVTTRVKFSGADNNSIAQGSANAVLRFSTQNIDRVIFMAPGGAAATYFMHAASTQGYKPLYGVWSADSPYVLGITAPKDQLAGTTGIGYQPGLDVASGQDPTATTPAAKSCLAFWDSVGQTDRSGLNNALKRASCDIFHTLVQAVAKHPNATSSTDALEEGFDAVAGSYAPAGTFNITFRAGSHDAASGYRRLTYQGDCSCFTYVGQTRALQ